MFPACLLAVELQPRRWTSERGREACDKPLKWSLHISMDTSYQRDGPRMWAWWSWLCPATHHLAMIACISADKMDASIE
jgi:hypothetical protein